MSIPGTPNTLNSTEPQISYPFDLLRLQAICPVPLFTINEWRVMAKRVLRVRQYFDGDHDAKLTTEMMDQLRIKDPDDGFTLNMMPSVVLTKADRCIVQSIEAVTDKVTQKISAAVQGKQNGIAPGATVDDSGVTVQPDDTDTLKDPRQNPSAWLQEHMEDNRFDILQGAVHERTICDGDGYVMVGYDNDEEAVRWTQEEAFDGTSGMLAYYPSRNVPVMALAIKIWQITLPNLNAPGMQDALTKWTAEGISIDSSNQIMFRVNVYYPDRVEKFFSAGLSSLQPFIEDGVKSNVLPWTDRNGAPLGIPITHFRNGGRHNFGVSELRNAISPQNALNRFNYSAVMIAEYTAFAILVANGHQPPDTIAPGMIYTMSKTASPSVEHEPTLTRLAAGDVKPILEMIDKERHLIADITRTPSPDLMGGSGSNKTGEYLKQLEIGLLGKVRAFQVRAGASWEAVGDMSWKVQSAFGTQQPPAYKRFRTTWRSAELRNETDIVKNAVMMDPIWGHEQTLHATASVFDLDEDKIAQIVTQQKAEVAAAQAMQAGNAGAMAIQDSINPGKSTVSVNEGTQTIAASGDTTTPPPAPAAPNGKPPANGTAPAAPKPPAIAGAKLPSGQALHVNPIHPDELAAVSAMHRRMLAAPNGAKA